MKFESDKHVVMYDGSCSDVCAVTSITAEILNQLLCSMTKTSKYSS